MTTPAVPDRLTDAEVQGYFDRANGLAGLAVTRALYADWAGRYDATIERFGRYLSPDRIAALVALHRPDRGAAVLDVACGTGLVGAALARQGYQGLSGLDLSEEMLAEARRKGCYGRLIARDVGEMAEVGRFAVVVCGGALTLGHLGVAGFGAMVALLAPGGLLVTDVEGGTFASQGFGAALEGMVGDGRLAGFDLAEGHFYTPAQDEPPHGWFLTAWRG